MACIFATKAVGHYGTGLSNECLKEPRGNHLLTIRRSTTEDRVKGNGAAMDQILMLRIRERAYEICAASGGDAQENWLRAEAEILKEANPAPIKASVKKKRPLISRTVPSALRG